ncbi:MAG: Monooxygenase, FAD-binding protein [Myxococcaceae bacterium]|nr:Monooxygenase, FAD-binding protein [Myxococcaceae bacterium]
MIGTAVVVVGGGFAGLVSAAALAARGATVTVLESHQGFDPRFRGELIHPRGVRGLETLGLKAPLFEAGGVAVKGFSVSPGADVTPIVLPYGVSFGTGLGIDHHAMVGKLREVVGKRPGVTLLTGQRVDALLQDGPRIRGVRTADGREFRAELTLGADGRQSKVRSLMGLEPEVKLLSFTVAVTVEGDVMPHPGHGHVFLGAPGPILAYPYGEGQIRMCIDVPVGEAKGKDAIKKYVKDAFARFVPEPLRSAMLASLDRRPLEGCATHAVSTQACAAPGIALVGDSGGCMHPLTAGGMTNAVNDVLTLSDCLGEELALDAALLEYQRRRYRFVRAREVFTEALYEVFRAHDDGAKALQAGTFRYWASSPRARATSMGILSAEYADPRTFVSEYARVMGLSTFHVCRDALKQRTVRQGASRMQALLSTSFERLERTFSRVVSTVVQERRAALHQVQPSAAPPRIDAAA